MTSAEASNMSDLCKLGLEKSGDVKPIRTRTLASSRAHSLTCDDQGSIIFNIGIRLIYYLHALEFLT